MALVSFHNQIFFGANALGICCKSYCPEQTVLSQVSGALSFQKGLAVKEIILTQGKAALVDDEDFEELSKFKWYAHNQRGNWYAERVATIGFKKRKTVRMHRLVMRAPEGTEVDHKDGNGLNNTRKNLRICTHTENQRNRRPSEGKSSVYKGVAWNDSNQRWQAYIRHQRKDFFLGYFATEAEAARVYDVKAREFFGEFAFTNFGGERTR